MSLRFLNMRPNRLSRTRHKAARRSRAEKLAAEFQIDNVVGAQRFDEVRLNRNIAGTLIPSDLHSLGTNADNESIIGACRWWRQRACETETLGGIRQEELYPPAFGVHPAR